MTLTSDWPAVLATEALDLFERLDEWDQPPILSLVFADEVVPFVTSDAVWSAAPPYIVLGAIAEALRTVGPPTDGTPVLGVMFMFEAWVIAESSTKTREYWQTHRIADDPDGREAACVTIVTTDGRVHSRQYERGGSAHDMDASEGRIVDALTAICSGFTTSGAHHA